MQDPMNDGRTLDPNGQWPKGPTVGQFILTSMDLKTLPLQDWKCKKELNVSRPGNRSR